jgi:hypothetical protein
MTLVAATGDLRPFQNRARQFGILYEGRFLPYDQPLDSAASGDAHLRELLGISE